MAQKKQKVQHEVKVTAEVHREAHRTQLQRKQPNPKQLLDLPFGKKTSEKKVESSGFCLSSVISPMTKAVLTRNVAHIIVQKVFKDREIEKQKVAEDKDEDIEVIGHKEGEKMRGAVEAVKSLVVKQAGRKNHVAVFDYDECMKDLIQKAKTLKK